MPDVAWFQNADFPWVEGGIARLCASCWDVAYGYRDPGTPERMDGLVRGTGGRAFGYDCTGGVPAAVVAAADVHGGFDALMLWGWNEPGVSFILDTDDCELARVMNPVYPAQLDTLRCVIPYLLGRPDPRVLFMAPRKSLDSPHGEAARLAILAMAKCTANELRDVGVTVNLRMADSMSRECAAFAAEIILSPPNANLIA